jgi:transcriptional regulator with GAF, ATPase, and Fis domain
MDENLFFRQAALRICGSLDIKKAAVDCLSYIKDFIPASELIVSWLDPETKTVRNLVSANPAGETWITPPIAVSENIIQVMEDRINEWQGVKIDNHPETDPAARIIIANYKTPDPSAMYIILVMEGVLLGMLGILAEGKYVFTDTHARLLALMREPCTIAISNALRYQEVLEMKEKVDAENIELTKELLRETHEEIIGAESGLAGVMDMVRQVAPMNSPVMILGETGVGKEVIANAIHYLSTRNDKAFIKVNCGAIPEGLIDAELFGHEKGAFTGAVSQKRGRFERADQGSIFLDEVGELPLQAQVRLLRVLQQKEVERVGGSEIIPVDVRIIAATNRNLEKMIQSGDFREDLWYRLNIFPIIIPPLRQRRQDIPDFVHHFLKKKAKELKIQSLPEISEQGMARLMNHSWPGNVRELENIIERELIRKRGREERSLLSFEYFDSFSEKELIETTHDARQSICSLDDVITSHIKDALKLSQGKIYGDDGAAKILRLNPNTLRSKMRKLGITVQQKRVIK